MKDLIDREAALACFHDWVDSRGDIHTADEMPEYRAVEALPSVGIVTCSKCIWWDDSPSNTIAPGYRKCRRIGGVISMTAADHCSRGERRHD